MKSCVFQVRGSLLSFNSIMSLKRKGLFILILSGARNKVLPNEAKQVLISSEARKKVLERSERFLFRAKRETRFLSEAKGSYFERSEKQGS